MPQITRSRDNKPMTIIDYRKFASIYTTDNVRCWIKSFDIVNCNDRSLNKIYICDKLIKYLQQNWFKFGAFKITK